VYYDVARRALLSATGAIARDTEYPYLYFTEKPLVRLRLVDGDKAIAYTGLSSGMSFVVSIDADYDVTKEPYVRSVDEDINVEGDWDDVDVEAGKLSIRLNSNTVTAQDALGTSAEASGSRLEFKGYLDGDLIFAVSFPFRFFNLMDPRITSLDNLDAFYAVIDSRYIRKNTEGANWRVAPDGKTVELFDSTDGFFYPLVLNNGVIGRGEAVT
jgi:hypothetical protein